MEKVLVVDDNEQNVEIIKDLLSAWGYDTSVAMDGTQVFNIVCSYKPDVIILDVMLPGMNGFEICKKLKNNIKTKNTPVIMLTVLSEVEDRIRGFNVGADVFLSKPIVYQELRNRVAWAVNYKKMLDSMEDRHQVIKTFLNTMKLKDKNLYEHSCMVKNYCEKVGKILLVTDEEMEQLKVGAYLHDVGKLISNKPEEHVTKGEQIIEPTNMYEWLRLYVRNHHEKMNGEGFPDGLIENEMSLKLKILITVNRFVELLEQSGDENESIATLNNECLKDYWSKDVLDALRQVHKDEEFIKSINKN